MDRLADLAIARRTVQLRQPDQACWPCASMRGTARHAHALPEEGLAPGRGTCRASHPCLSCANRGMALNPRRRWRRFPVWPASTSRPPPASRGSGLAANTPEENPWRHISHRQWRRPRDGRPSGWPCDEPAPGELDPGQPGPPRARDCPLLPMRHHPGHRPHAARWWHGLCRRPLVLQGRAGLHPALDGSLAVGSPPGRSGGSGRRALIRPGRPKPSWPGRSRSEPG
jgi:hypothetical protein